MNKSHGLLAAAVLALALTGCSTGADTKSPAEISKPHHDSTQSSQPTPQFHRDPDCRHIPCPR